MILIQLNKQDFEYDLHSLVKSFYPGEDVTVCYEEPENAGEAHSENLCDLQRTGNCGSF